MATSTARPPAKRGPKGARVGCRVVADGTVWTVIALDLDRREVVVKLDRGSHAIRRFTARRIVKVERAEAAP